MLAIRVRGKAGKQADPRPGEDERWLSNCRSWCPAKQVKALRRILEDGFESPKTFAIECSSEA
ncbi:MAG: hypothetical protein V1694_01560 [Candidatus Eisenbacteria bacterium]